MKHRSMIIVAAGSASRFGSDKLLTEIDGRPLIAWTIEAILPVVDECVLVTRGDQRDSLSSMFPEVTAVVGGENRTESEIAGLAAVSNSTLIGIHDGARPAVPTDMVTALFEAAALHGGAIPGLSPHGQIINRENQTQLHHVQRVQTPQVFWGPELRSAYRAATAAGFTGDDTADIVHNFSNLDIAVVGGDPANIKATVPEDLERLRQILSN